MKRINLPLIKGASLLMAAILIAACGGGGSGPNSSRIDVPGDGDPGPGPGPGPGDPTFCEDPLQLLRIDNNGIVPADGATDVPLNSVINVRFSHAVSPASVSDTTIFLTAEGAPVDVTRQVNGRNVTLTPNAALTGATEYTLTIGGQIEAAACVDTDTSKFLSDNDVGDRTFTTGTQPDAIQPTIVSITPADGASLVPQDASVTIIFSEPVLADSITSSTVTLTRLDTSSTVDGTLDVKSEIVVFTPATPLLMQRNYRLDVSTNVRDLAGNSLQNAGQSEFRTGGVVVGLNDDLIREIPGLSDLINGPLADLLTQIGLVPDQGGGAGNLDNLAIITLPLPTDINNPTEFDNLLIAVCDPDTPGEPCALSLSAGLNPDALGQLADAFTGGDPEALLEALANALVAENGVLSIDLALLEDGLPGVTQILDDVPLLSDALGMIVGALEDGLTQVPVLNELVDQLNLFGPGSVVDLGLLGGSLLQLDVGDDEYRLLELSVLDPTSGTVLDLSGGLISDVLDPVLGALDPVLDPVNELLCNTIPLLCLRR